MSSTTTTSGEACGESRDILNSVRIAAPCAAKWETMPGGERVRSCAQCGHKVYNLSSMSSSEAASLIQSAEGRLCVRLYRRADGSVMTRDCPTGLRAVRQRVARTTALAFASFFTAVGLVSLAHRLRGGAEAPAPATAAPVAVPLVEHTVPMTLDPTAPLPNDPTNPTPGDPTVPDAAPPSEGYVTGMVAAPVRTAPETSGVVRSSRQLPVLDSWQQPAEEKTFLPPAADAAPVAASGGDRDDPFVAVPGYEKAAASAAQKVLHR